MATAGPNYPGTSANRTGVGSTAWTDPSNAGANDSSNVTITDYTGGGTTTSNYLHCSNFGFSIPGGSTINGITVNIERWVLLDPDSQGVVSDNRVSIVKADNTIGTTNKSKAPAEWETTATVSSYGGAADLWGETWTSSDINDVDFGFVISVDYYSALKRATTIYVDYATITITYTAGGAAFIAKSTPRFRQAINRASTF